MNQEQAAYLESLRKGRQHFLDMHDFRKARLLADIIYFIEIGDVHTALLEAEYAGIQKNGLGALKEMFWTEDKK